MTGEHRSTGPPDTVERTAISTRALAKVLGVSASTVARDIAARDRGDGTVDVGRVMSLDGRVRPSRRFDTTERDVTIRRLQAEGRTIRQIAAEVRVSVGTVHRVLTATSGDGT